MVRRNGRNVKRQRIFSGTREQAKRLFEDLKEKARAGDGSLKATDISTFERAAAIFIEKRKQAPSDTHLRMIQFLVGALGAVSLVEFPARFESWLKLYRVTPTKQTGKYPGNGAANRFVSIARAVYNLMRALNLFEGENPISGARFPKLKEIPRDVSLGEQDKKNLLNTLDAQAPHLSAIVRFAMQVPCRRSELVNMKREDLDLFGSCIRVRNGTTKNDCGTWKKIPADMRDYFRNLPSETEYLFYRRERDGTYHKLGDFKRAWNRCLKLAGLKGAFRFHDTRHVSASALVDNGTPEQVVMMLAGWKTNMLRVYYNRQPKKALELVRFPGECIPDCIPASAAN
jgi:integrase